MSTSLARVPHPAAARSNPGAMPAPAPTFLHAVQPRPKVAIGRTDDPLEHAAERAATRALHPAASRIAAEREAPAPSDQQPGRDFAHMRVHGAPTAATAARGAGGAGLAASTHAARLVATARAQPARPLPPLVRERLEHGFGAPLGHVRLHSGPHAAAAARAIGARAYTEGSRITLAAGESEHDLRLLAHEAAHVLQNDGAAQPIRRQPDGGSAPAPADPSLASGLIWSAVDKLLPPDLVALVHGIRDQGLFATLKARIAATLDGILGPLPNVGAQAEAVVGLFTTLLDTARSVVAALAAGDCRPFFAALGRLKDAVAEMAGEAWDKAVAFFKPIGDYLADLWKRFGAPVADWLASVGGALWQQIKELGAKIGAVVEDVKLVLSSAWDEVKHVLGIGDGPDDHNGLVQWIQQKAEAAWGEIKAELQPVITPIQAVVSDIAAFIPLDKILHLRDTVTEWLNAVAATAGAMGDPAQVPEQQDSLRKTILPAVLASVARLRGSIVEAGAWVAGKIGALTAKITGFIGQVAANKWLAPLAGALGWVQSAATSLSGWAQQTVTGLFALIGNGLVRLSKFIEPVLNALERLASALGDLLGRIGDLILGPLKLIPGCILDPIKQFLLEQVLQRVPFFSLFAKLPDIWAKLEATALRILRQIFVDGNLRGAAWTFFCALLDILKIPVKLVTGIVAKAATAFGDILRDPVKFLLNMLGALKQGFAQFFGNIVRHLLSGIADWMFSAAADAGLQVPTEFSLRAILGFVLHVLGVTVEHVFERIEKRLGKPIADRLRGLSDKAARVADAVASAASSAFAWLDILMREGPAGLYNHLHEKLADLKDQLLNGAVSWLEDKLIGAAATKLLKLLDPTGIMAVVEALDAISSAAETLGAKAAQILGAVDAMLDGLGDIAKGVLGKAAGFVENAVACVVPVVITFLANWMKLGGIGKRIGEVVHSLQAKVEGAIDWLIDKGRVVVDRLGGKSGDPAADALDTDPKELAVKELQTRLAGETNFAKADQVVTDVRAKLAPAGLHQLVLTRHSDTSGFSIQGAASELTDLFVLRPYGKGTKVQLAGEVSMRSGSPMEGISNIGSPFDNPADQQVTGGRQQALFGQPAQMGLTQIGGLIIVPRAGETSLQLVTWNTGETIEGTNTSHAELQFVAWLRDQGDPWLARVAAIALEVSHSPCGNCVDNLVEVNRIKALPAGITKTISWDKLWAGPTATTSNDIAKLKGAHWSILAKSLPAGAAAAPPSDAPMTAEAVWHPKDRVMRRRKPTTA